MKDEQRCLFEPSRPTTLVKNLETLVCVSPFPMLIGYYSRLSAPKYAWLNTGNKEGTFE